MSGQITRGEFEARAASWSPPTKRVTMPLGAPQTTSPAGNIADWAERFPIVTPVRTVRWRMKFANRNVGQSNAGTALTTPVTVQGLYTGRVANTGTARVGAGYAATPAKVFNGGAVPVNGTDLVTPWVEDPALQCGPNGDMLLVGWNITATASGNGVGTKGTQYGFRHIAAGAAGTAGVASGAGYAAGQGALDVRFEYEFVGNEPVGLVIGQSNDEGYNPLEVAANLNTMFAHEPWPTALGHRKGFPVINAAIAGAREQPFMNAGNFAYTRLDLSTTVPDFAIVNLGGNSILNGVSAATAQNNVLSVLGALYTIGVRKWFLCTMQPAALASGSATEIQRAAYNDWVRSAPMGVGGVLDFDMWLRNPSDALNLRPEHRVSDNIHLRRIGQQFLADQINL